MNLLYYVVLSFVQAATEFLPISSSGHLLFFKGFLKRLDIPILFDVVVHIGSLTAIAVFYRKRIRATFGGAWVEFVGKRREKKNLGFLSYIVLSTLVTFVFYLVLKEPIDARYQSPSVLCVSYTLTTVVLFATFFVADRGKREITDRSLWLPFIVGLCQGLAVMPGISRSGFTIAPLLLLGIRREEAAYYSFFLAIPAISGALVVQCFETTSVSFLSRHWEILALSLAVSMGFSYLFLNVLTFVLRKGKFWLFSGYTLIMAGVSFVLFR